LLEKILENYKKNMLELDEDLKVNLASSLASNFSMRSDKALDTREMEALISQLFSSTMPEISPGGKKIIREIKRDEIEKLFK
jgi:DNA mismatch repair protein MutL